MEDLSLFFYMKCVNLKKFRKKYKRDIMTLVVNENKTLYQNILIKFKYNFPVYFLFFVFVFVHLQKSYPAYTFGYNRKKLYKLFKA